MVLIDSEISQNASRIEKIIEDAIEEHEKSHVSYYHNEPYHPIEFWNWNLCAEDVALRVSKDASLRELHRIEKEIQRLKFRELDRIEKEIQRLKETPKKHSTTWLYSTGMNDVLQFIENRRKELEEK